LIEFPNDFVPPFQKALKDAVIACNDLINFMPKKKLEEQQFYVGFSGSFFHHLNPRTLKSIHLSKLISIVGIVSRCSFVRLKLAKSVHHCGKTGEFHQKEYRDFTTIGNFIPTSNAYPTEDGSGNQLTTEFGYSVYRDHQTICLQEMPEKAPAGQLLRSIDIVLDDDLVDKVKPGDRIQLAGIYRAIGKPSQNSTSATFRTVLIATNITILSGDMCNNIITADDSSKIEEIAKQRKDDIFEFLTKSLAPSIYATAHAKARLREKVTVKDAKVAEEIVRFALFKEVINKKVKRRTRRNNHKRHKGKGRMEVDSPPKGDENTNQSTLSQNRYETFRELFSKITSKFLSKIKYDELLEEINKLSAENNIEHFDVEEMKSALEAMEKDGKALRTDDSVFLI
ncbi:1913_t:CDS:2, partial [Entrophospora sp. SA101]